MKDQILFIGGGAMAEAIIRGCLEKQVLTKEQIIVKGNGASRVAYMTDTYGIQAISSLEAIPETVKTVILAVKPPIIPSVLDELGSLPASVLVISIAAGVGIFDISSKLSDNPVIRVMPNTPLMVGEGMTAISPCPEATEEQVAFVEQLFGSLGKTAVGSEALLDALGALSGCGPAYAFVIIDALSDAGVRIGLPRKVAIEAAAQTLLGAAKMVLETGQHPAVLRDQVTSPGGTTIAALHTMEAAGLRGALIDGVYAAMERTREMKKE